MKLALVHDWLLNVGGAERVLIELHKMYPQAPIYTLFYDKDFVRQYLPGADIRSSFLQKFPLITTHYKLFAILMPAAIESFDLSVFDTVLSSSVIFSKGLVLRPQTYHICYCYSPTRQLWDWQARYRGGRVARHFLRIWDRSAADRVDQFVAISQTVAARIKKYYKQDSIVIYPPVAQLQNSGIKIIGHYYLIVSRLFKHKNIDIAIEAFNKLGYNLVIVGDGPERKKLSKIANPNIRFAGHINDDELAGYYANCRALIMPQEEDLGLTPLEALSFGRPVLALRQGGATETIIEGVTGEFFDDPIPEALADGVKRLNQNYASYLSEVLKSHAQKFSLANFRNQINEIVSHHS